MSVEENKEIVRRVVEEGTNKGNAGVLEEIMAPDAVDHTAPPGQPSGPEGVMRGLTEFREAFPDAHATIEHLVAEDDMVTYHVTMKATNTGEFMGRPPTGKSFTAGSLNMVRIRDGRLVEHWSYLDTISMMTQLGLMEMPE